MLLHTAASQQRRGAAAGATPPPTARRVPRRRRPAGARAPKRGSAPAGTPASTAAARAQTPRQPRSRSGRGCRHAPRPPRRARAAMDGTTHGAGQQQRAPTEGGWLPPASTPCVRRSRTPWRASGPHHHKRSSEGIDTQGNSSKPDQGTRAGKPERATRSNAGSRGKRKKQVQTRNSSRQVAPSQPRGMHGRQANRWQQIEALAGTGSMASGN